MTRWFLAVLLLGFSLSSLSVQAHSLNVFASAEGNLIEGSVYYAGGEHAAGAKVVARSAQGRVLADLRADAEGRFSFQAAEPIDHLIVAETAEGHLGTWTLSGVELAGSGSTPAGVISPLASGAPVGGAETGCAPDETSLDALVEASLARQIRPLREQIIKQEERVRLRDLLGGIGYIFGVAGLVLWWRSRSDRRRA